MVKERPILFSTEMVKAILDGRKTMTRRIVPERILEDYYNFDDWCNSVGKPEGVGWYREYEKEVFMKRRRWEVGSRLWVREMLYQNGELGLKYVADNEDIDEDIIPENHKPYRNYAFCNIPSIHMPRWASRITLEITDIKVERIQDISWEDAEKEGCYGYRPIQYEPTDQFRDLWIKINGQESWSSNPWVFAIEFEKIKK